MNPFPKPRVVLTAGIATLLSLKGTASAQETWVWTGATDTDWNTPTNWSTGAVPAGAHASITTIPANIATISSDIIATPVDIFVGSGAGANGRLDHTAGIAGTGDSNWMFVGTQGGTGIYNLADTTTTTSGTLTGYGLGSGSLNVGGPNPTAGRLYIGGRENGTGGVGTVNINTTGTLKIGNDLVIGSRGGTGVMNLDAGTVTTNGWNFVGVENGLAGGNGMLRISGGTFSQLLSRTYVGLGNAVGSIVITGGTFNNLGTSLDTQFAIGVLNNAAPTPSSVTLSGGTINANRLFTIGGTEGFGGNNGSTGAGKGIFTMDGDGALLNITGELWVGNASGSVGTMNVSAGTVKVNNWVAVGRNGSNGTLTLSGTGRIEKTGSGNFEVGGGAGGVGVLNLDGGTLNTHNITRNGAGSGTVNFNGGLLQANQSNAAFMENLSNAFVKSGGARIDTQEFKITIAQSLLADFLSTGGGLTKLGSGELALTGVNTYEGRTLVSEGSLVLRSFGSINFSSEIEIDGPDARFVQDSGDIVTSPIKVTNGTLDGTGFVSSVTVGDGTGGRIANGSGLANTLTIADLTFTGAGTIDALMDTPFIPALTVNNSLTTGSVNSSGVVTINARTTTGLWANDAVYDLIVYSNLDGVGFSAFEKGTIAGLSARQTATLGNTGSAITLTISGDYAVWSGALDGNWTTAVQANPKNWRLQSAGTATDFIDGDVVFFDDSANTGTLNISDANVDITRATFENSTLDYTISSTGGFGITGGEIIKSGSASLTLNTANSHTGGVTLNDGTLNINHASALGTGPLTIAGGTIDNTSGAAIALTTNNAQHWLSDVTFAGTNALNLGNGPVTLGNDASDQIIVLTNNSTLPGDTLTIGGSITPADGGVAGVKTLMIQGTGDVALTGNISTGTAAGVVINANLPGTLTLSGANQFRTLNIDGGPDSIIEIGAGDLNLANGLGDIVQSLTGGTINATGGGTLTIGSANADFGTATGTTLVVNAKISGTNTVDFYSPNGALGKLVLTAANPHSGGTNVENTHVVIPASGAINAMNLPDSGQLNVGTFNGARGILELDGGTINATKSAGASASIGNVIGSTGVMKVTEGTFNSVNELWVGTAENGYGSLVLSGGTVNVGNWLAIGRSGNGYVEVSGGTLNLTGQNLTTGSFTSSNGSLPSSFGVVSISGGVVNLTNTAENQGGYLVAESGIGQLNMSGTGELNISGARGLHLGVNATGFGIANLNGGTVTTPQVQKGGGTGILNFDGGTLKASASNGTFLQGLNAAYVFDGGAIIDDGGFNITIAQPLLAPMGNGVASIAVNGGIDYIGAPLVLISGDGLGATAVANIDEDGTITGITVTNPGVGYTSASVTLIGGGGSGAFVEEVNLAPNTSGGFIKQGTGNVTLSAVNTYTGPTVVEAGTLTLTGSISASNSILLHSSAILDVTGVGGGFTVATGQTLAGSGTVLGNVTLGVGAALSPGQEVGTMTFGGNLDLTNAVSATETGALRFDISTLASSDQAVLTSGVLTIGEGVLAFDDFAFTGFAGLDEGVYTLFDTGQPIVGTLDSANVNGLVGGRAAWIGISESGDDLILTVIPEPGTATLLLAGLGSMLALRRRRS